MSDDILPSPTTASNGPDRVQKRNGSISNSAGASNARSCLTCRKRKVKCDKKQPCSNCARAKIECVFPGPGRAPRKSRKPPDGELMDRLRRLEGVVQSLNAQVEEHEQEAADRTQTQDQDRSRQASSSDCFPSRVSPSVALDNTVEGLESRFGRLVVDQGRSRYINNSFWASLNNEVCVPRELPQENPLIVYRSKISRPSSSNPPTTKTNTATRPIPPTLPSIRASFSDTALRM